MKDIIRILRNTDGADGGTTQMADPLDTNVNDVDISYPVIPAGWYDMIIGECTLKENKRGDGQNLVVPHKLVSASQDKKGNPVSAGFTITAFLPCQPAEKKDGTWTTNDDVKRGIAKVARAFGVNATVRGVITTPGLLNGKTAKVEIGISKATDEFAESNKIKGYVK